jgi:hypothetical protein
MKRLLLILILTFSFQTLSKADDIRDFQIEGISLGDSLLNFLNFDEIQSLYSSHTSGSKKYIRYYEVKKANNYDGMDVWVLLNDNKFIIHSLTGFIDYPNNIKDCYPKKKLIVSSIESQLTMKGNSYISNYDNNTSRSDVTDFNISHGSIRIWCTDYSKKKEVERNYIDYLGVTASSEKFIYWLDNEAYK